VHRQNGGQCTKRPPGAAAGAAAGGGAQRPPDPSPARGAGAARGAPGLRAGRRGCAPRCPLPGSPRELLQVRLEIAFTAVQYVSGNELVS